MKAEVATAVNFITTLLRGTGLLTEEQLQHFSHSLEEALGGEIKHNIAHLRRLTKLFRVTFTLSFLWPTQLNNCLVFIEMD